MASVVRRVPGFVSPVSATSPPLPDGTGAVARQSPVHAGSGGLQSRATYGSLPSISSVGQVPVPVWVLPSRVTSTE